MLLHNLANVLRDAGLTVVEIDGWQNRGYLGRDLAEIRGVVWHHTVSNRNSFATNDAPALNICTFGRADVAGPLCQLVLGRSGTVYVTAAGLSNHAGAGNAAGIPTDMGNYYLIGIEMESSGVAPWDWTLDQLRVVPHLGAALERAYLSHLPEDARLQISHKEYSSEGKIDPAGWPGGMDGLRDSINRVLAGDTAPVVAPQIVPAAPAAVERPGGYPECIVDPGDTLGGIAAQFGVPLAALIAVNPQLTNPDRIDVGQVLNLPNGAAAPSVTQCIVDPGDTLGGIAAQFGVTIDRLLQVNPVLRANPDLIYPGQVLNL